MKLSAEKAADLRARFSGLPVPALPGACRRARHGIGSPAKTAPEILQANREGVSSCESDSETDGRERCHWARSPLMVRYHDEEWGVPLHDDRRLFEFLILEGAQAGLSWETDSAEARELSARVRPLRRRENRALRQAQNSQAARRSRDRPQPAEDRRGHCERAGVSCRAQGIRQLRQVCLVVRRRQAEAEYLAKRAAGSSALRLNRTRLSKDLKKRGFRFVGSTICYSFMQAVGMVNDHAVECYCRRSAGARDRFAHIAWFSP